MVRLCPKTPHLWSTLMNKDSYWTPSRCAKILIGASVTGLPANSYIYRKEMGWKWLIRKWQFAGTQPKVSVPGQSVNTTIYQLQFHPLQSWLPWLLTCSSHNDTLKRFIYD